MSNHIAGYAEGLAAIAKADGHLEIVKSELLTMATAIAGNEDLRSTLANNLLPAATRGQIVDDLLANKANNTTRALAGMIVSSGHGSDFGKIVDAFVTYAASSTGAQVATVRTAVALSEDQKARLQKALKSRTGGEISLQEIVDPSVVGGAVTTIGDTVIDGTVRARLAKMKDIL